MNTQIIQTVAKNYVDFAINNGLTEIELGNIENTLVEMEGWLLKDAQTLVEELKVQGPKAGLRIFYNPFTGG